MLRIFSISLISNLDKGPIDAYLLIIFSYVNFDVHFHTHVSMRVRDAEARTRMLIGILIPNTVNFSVHLLDRVLMELLRDMGMKPLTIV